jgi:hypothetical protein
MRWISDTFRVPVGSEGGNYLATPVITVAEGIFVPVIGFGDPDMTSKLSPWYTGAYYPPDGPDVFLKGVPLKESYIHLFVDPRFRVPLYETVFHDSVITSAHWSSSHLKYTNVWQTLALTQVLYQAAPLYHLNLDAFAEAKTLIQASASIFAATHSYSWRYPLESFRYLTEDRLVQESVFGALHLVANFGSTSYRGEGISVPPRSVLARGEGLDTVYTP